MHKLLLTAGFLGVAAFSAHAQSIPDINGLGNENAGDLVLGFTNPNVSNELDVDIGPADDYYSTTNAIAGPLTPGQTYSVVAFHSSDLTTVLGSNAYSSSTSWGVIGGNGLNGGGPGPEASGAVWLTSSGVALTAGTQSAQTGSSNQFEGVADNIGGTPPTSLSQDAYQQPSNGATSYTHAANLGQLYTVAQITGNTSGAAASGTTTLALWELLPTNVAHSGPAAVDLGYFTLSSTGLTFTAAAAIPEPSTYAAILGAVTIGFVLVRRRRSANLV